VEVKYWAHFSWAYYFNGMYETGKKPDGLASERIRMRHNVAYKLIFADEILSTFGDNNIYLDTWDATNILQA